MKVATACIFCLIMTVVYGAVFQVRSVVNKVNGRKVTQCSINWGKTKYTINIGEKLHLPSVNGGLCVDCGPCRKKGMACAQLLGGNSECPAHKWG